MTLTSLQYTGPVTNLFVSAALALGGLFLIAGLSAAASPSASELYDSAVFQESAAGNLDKAINLYEEAAAADTPAGTIRDKALFKEALCYEKLGRLDLASRTMQRALRSGNQLAPDMAVDGRNNLMRWRAELSSKQPTPQGVTSAPAASPEASTQEPLWLTGFDFGYSVATSKPTTGFANDQPALGVYAGRNLSSQWSAQWDAIGFLPGSDTFVRDSADATTSFHSTADATSHGVYTGPSTRWNYHRGRWGVSAGLGAGVSIAQESVDETAHSQLIAFSTTTFGGATTVAHHSVTEVNATLLLQGRASYDLSERWSVTLALRDLMLFRRDPDDAVDGTSPDSGKTRAWHLLLPSMGIQYVF